MQAKFKDGSSEAPKVGMRVRCGRYIRTIEYVYLDIVGGVKLNKPVKGFFSWNIEELTIIKE